LTSKLRSILTFACFLCCLSLYSIDWQTWRYGDINVWSAPKDTAYANIIVKRLHQRINAFQLKLGVYPVKPLVIKILPNRKEYRAITSGKGKLVEFSEAFYSPGEKVIYVRSPDQILPELYDQVLMHEYIHWFLDETMDNVPLWFHEGMAYYYSGQFGFYSYYNFTRYRFLGYKLTLNEMANNYPIDRNYWDMYYLTSAFAVSHLESKRNTQWQEFWDIIGFTYNRSRTVDFRKTDFIKVFNHAFQKSLYAFSREFDKTLKRYGWQFPLIGINAIIFSLLPLVIIAGWFRHRRKMKALPDVLEETPEETEDQTPETTEPDNNPDQ